MKADEKLKKEIYKKRFVKDSILKSHYPNGEEIDFALSTINLKESLFKEAPVVDGALFDSHTYNAQMEDLELDLKFIYQLVKEYTFDELQKLSEFADTTLSDLERKAEFYLTKSKMEMQSSDLGYTALYMHAPFHGEQKGDYFLIDCGIIQLTEGSTIHLLLEGSNIYYARLKLEKDDGTHFYLTPYQLNRDSFTLPGDITTHEKNVVISYFPAQDEKILLPYKPEPKSIYTVLTGKDKIACKSNGISHYENNMHHTCFEETMIDFYVKDATSIRIHTSHKPLYTNYNFSNEAIKLEKGIKHFYLQMPAKSAIEIFLEGGEIYAQKGKGVVQEGKLYFSQSTPFKEFLVIEKMRTKKQSYHASLEVHSTLEQLGVDSILLKELI